ncbi:hypothetical protein [Flavobacterium sp. NRK1]|uniref:hypothetical protein n=1 Tax=Flavobacterium sp. NRK1 TaxID=2954929 RepID=UPI00209321E7|nr:hypothetical protein [Flavobacterium sp. NRK1]MCO6148108.1 hypothetical protein [Flavobacterium sp. NRK1]
MKNLNLIFTAAAIVLTTGLASAQVQQTPVHSGQIYVMKEKSQPATGSMFINEKYMPARLSNSDKTVLARYNAYSDKFEISNPLDGTNTILPLQKDVSVNFTSTGDTYVLQQYKTDDDEIINGYLNLVSDKPNVKIFKRERIYLQPEVFPASSYQTYKPANYKKVNDEFYISLKGQDAVYFSSKKDLAKLIPAKSKEILSFIKKNKLDLDKEADLEQLGNYLDGIL